MKKITNLFKNFIKNKKEEIKKVITMCLVFVLLVQTNSYAGIIDGDVSSLGMAIETLVRIIGAGLGIRGFMFLFEAYNAWAESKGDGGGQQNNKFRDTISAAAMLIIGCAFIELKGCDMLMQFIGL